MPNQAQQKNSKNPNFSGIKVTSKLREIIQQKKYFLAGIDILVFFPDTNKPVKSRKIVIKENGINLKNLETDTFGHAFASIAFEHKYENSSVDLDIFIENHAQPTTVTITLPSLIKEVTPENNPTKLEIFPRYVGKGQYKVFALVTKELGAVVKGAYVAIICGSELLIQKTNNIGVAEFELPALRKKDFHKIVAFVSHVEKAVSLKLCHRNKINNPKRFSRKWIYSWNSIAWGLRKFAIVSLFILVGIVSLKVFVGSGYDPLLTPPKTELSFQEKAFNVSANEESLIKVEDSKGQFPFRWFLLVFGVGLVSVGITFLANLDQFLNILKSEWEDHVSGASVSVSDPISERILGFLNMYKAAKNKDMPIVKEENQNMNIFQKTKIDDRDFWESFLGSAFADVVVKAIPVIYTSFKKI
jgi:hypothetical protein